MLFFILTSAKNSVRPTKHINSYEPMKKTVKEAICCFCCISSFFPSSLFAQNWTLSFYLNSCISDRKQSLFVWTWNGKANEGKQFSLLWKTVLSFQIFFLQSWARIYVKSSKGVQIYYIKDLKFWFENEICKA